LFLEHLNNFTTNCIFAGSFDAAMRIAWRAIVSEIPHSSKSIIPGRTLATQYSRLPFPDPIRVSAGRFVIALSGRIRIQSLPIRRTYRVKTRRLDSICREVTQAGCSV
jgi:hypothetical protein